jgi:hypothetical protein
MGSLVKLIPPEPIPDSLDDRELEFFNEILTNPE